MFVEELQETSQEPVSSRETPAQDKLNADLCKMNKQLADMLSLRQSGMSRITYKQIKDLKDKIHTTEINLSRYKIEISS